MKEMNAMLLAAGEGTRLRPFTEKIPKPAIPLLGAPLICYSLCLLEDIRIGNLVANVFHLPDQIEALVRDINPDCRNLCFSDERAQLLGSGGGIYNAERDLKGRGEFLVTNADEVIIPRAPNLIVDFIEKHQSSKSIATLMVMEHPEVGGKFGGVWTANGEHVDLFSKKTPGRGLKGFHFIGPMMFDDQIFSFFKPYNDNGTIQVENILYETLTRAIGAGESVQIFIANVDWFEVGNPEDFVKTEVTLQKILGTRDPGDFQAQFLRALSAKYGQRPSIVKLLA